MALAMCAGVSPNASISSSYVPEWMNCGRPLASSVLIASTFCEAARCALAPSIQHLQKVLQDVAVVLFGQADQLARLVQLEQKIFVDRRHVDDADLEPSLRALVDGGERLVNPAAAADDHRGVVGALTQHVPLAELERVVAAVDAPPRACASRGRRAVRGCPP